METSPQTVINLSINWSTFAIVAAALFSFSIIYNQFITWLADRQEGYTSLLVVAGVMVTLIGYAFISGIVQALIVAGLFLASGLPMIAGEVTRVIQKRNHIRGEVEKKAWSANDSAN
jgi:hypothetical protein